MNTASGMARRHAAPGLKGILTASHAIRKPRRLARPFAKVRPI
jgi:hypothetical protein